MPTKEEETSSQETGAPGSTQQAAGTTKKETTTTAEYQVGKTVKQQVIVPGEIKSLSVAAFVDLSPADPNSVGQDGQPALIMQVADVEQIIRTALGLKEADSLKVVNAKFHHAAEPVVEEEKNANWPRYLAIARHLSLGIMAICALLVLRIFRRAHGRATAEMPAQPVAGGAGSARLLSAGESPAEPLMLRRQITHALRSNPEQVKEMFLSWIQEKE
ncbi:MAG: hypothetical protein A2Y76_06900 [Planctomycetes bacterium RBG_13_60_9]|nr:MAG: hypothetical protein A2Y76_06900 [Planctomycetes bacterium RBG_13_60_9]